MRHEAGLDPGDRRAVDLSEHCTKPTEVWGSTEPSEAATATTLPPQATDDLRIPRDRPSSLSPLHVVDLQTKQRIKDGVSTDILSTPDALSVLLFNQEQQS